MKLILKKGNGVKLPVKGLDWHFKFTKGSPGEVECHARVLLPISV
jgi:hypothetical protein